MRLHFHDNTPAGPGEKHGSDGPTHCGSVSVDYAYQAEMWIEDIERNYPDIHRVRCPDLRREWKRGEDGKMAETTWDTTPPVVVGIVPDGSGVSF